MSPFKTTSRDLVAGLELAYAPVGVTLYRDTDPLPPGLPFAQENLKSYCQALALAGERPHPALGQGADGLQAGDFGAGV